MEQAVPVGVGVPVVVGGTCVPVPVGAGVSVPEGCAVPVAVATGVGVDDAVATPVGELVAVGVGNWEPSQYTPEIEPARLDPPRRVPLKEPNIRLSLNMPVPNACHT